MISLTLHPARARSPTPRMAPHLHPVPPVPCAHVPGKGSTTAFISSALRTAGYSVGVYTSPHLRSIRERISTHPARCIAPGAFAALVAGNADAVRAAAREEGGRLTHFEVLTALAFKWVWELELDSVDRMAH